MLIRSDAMQKVASSNFDVAIAFYRATLKVLSAVTAELFDYSGNGRLGSSAAPRRYQACWRSKAS